MRRTASIGKIVTLRAPVLVQEGVEDTQITCPVSEVRNIQGTLAMNGMAKGATSQPVGVSPKMVCITVYGAEGDEVAEALSSVGYTVVFTA